MEDRRTIGVTVGRGEKQQFLLEAGSMVLVISGEVGITQTTDWMCGQALRVGQRLVSEEVWVAETGGWVDIVGSRSAQLVVIPPDRISFWRRVGCCLEAWIGTAGKPADRAG